VDGTQDPRPDKRARGHAQEGQRTDDAQRAGSGIPVEQVRGRRGGDRHEDAPADRLEDARRDQLLE
jgi:hypothetical protein